MVVWTELDSWLVSEIEAEMGADGVYDDLQVQTVIATVLGDVADWKGWDLPAVAVVGRDVIRQPQQHGDREAHYGKEYPYFIVAITEGDQESATHDVKILEKRLETVIRRLNAPNIVDDSEERANRLLGGHSMVRLARKQSSSSLAKGWYGYSSFELKIEAMV